MKKRAVSSLLASLAVVSIILPALAAAPPDEYVEEPMESVETQPETVIYLDGVPRPSVEYEIRNGVCFVTVDSFVAMIDPEAMVEEEYGVTTVNAATMMEVVDTEGDGTATAMVVDETLNMTVIAGASCIVANDRYLYAEDGLILLNDSVAAPVRLMAEVFNLSVEYDSVGHMVLLGHQVGANSYLAPGELFYDSDILYWLSRIINAESGNQSLEGKIAVGNVVMNRVADPLFPDTLYDVLFQKNQFTPASSGSINRTPNEESVLAAKLVMDGAEVMPDALFFSQAGISCFASRHRTYLATIGDHAFYA